MPDGDTHRSSSTPDARSGSPELCDESTVRTINQDAFISGVGDINFSHCIDSQSSWPIECLIGFGRVICIPLQQELTFRTEFHNSMIPGIRHKNFTFGADGDSLPIKTYLAPLRPTFPNIRRLGRNIGRVGYPESNT